MVVMQRTLCLLINSLPAHVVSLNRAWFYFYKHSLFFSVVFVCRLCFLTLTGSTIHTTPPCMSCCDAAIKRKKAAGESLQAFYILIKRKVQSNQLSLSKQQCKDICIF